jgi:uncharacterized protein (DUF1684 family)
MKHFQYLFFLLCYACSSSLSVPSIDDRYLLTFEQYKVDRQLERNGYLKLCGLFKLPELTSTFGSDSSSDFHLNLPELPSEIGVFTRAGDQIAFIPKIGLIIENEDGIKVVADDLVLDASGTSEKHFLGSLSWRIITRGGEPYVRIWNEENPALMEFVAPTRFDLTTDFIFPSDFKYYREPKQQVVSTQLGPPDTTHMIGQLSFEYQGETHTLDVGNGGFTMVGDGTTGVTTYGGGRYIDLNLPAEDGQMLLDLNFLYNPPCTFSDFTTCQYPPEQNLLPFKILSGELYSNHL